MGFSGTLCTAVSVWFFLPRTRHFLFAVRRPFIAGLLAIIKAMSVISISFSWIEDRVYRIEVGIACYCKSSIYRSIQHTNGKLRRIANGRSKLEITPCFSCYTDFGCQTGSRAVCGRDTRWYHHEENFSRARSVDAHCVVSRSPLAWPMKFHHEITIHSYFCGLINGPFCAFCACLLVCSCLFWVLMRAYRPTRVGHQRTILRAWSSRFEHRWLSARRGLTSTLPPSRR